MKSIQELREKKEGRVVTIGIGGPSGSGKTRWNLWRPYPAYAISLIKANGLVSLSIDSSPLFPFFFWLFCSLAEKVASLLGCVIISMENYRNGADDGNDLDSIDFNALVLNLEVPFFWNCHSLQVLIQFQCNKEVLSGLSCDCSCIAFSDGWVWWFRFLWLGFVEGEGYTCSFVWFSREETCGSEASEDISIWGGMRSSVISTGFIVYCTNISLWNSLQVIVDGAYALHSSLRSLLDIRVAVVSGFE